MTWVNRHTTCFFLCATILLLLFVSCKQTELYEKDTVIPKQQWQSNFTATGSFNITDTFAHYNIYVVLRHTDAYKYNNIWLNIGLQSQGDSIIFQKADLLLGNDAAGWEGTGMNDIWEVRKLLNGEPRKFKRTGIYHFIIAQIMRENPLSYVMSAGLRVEKVKD